MACTTIRPKSREEWLEVRKSGIGSSEVPTILGLNPYDTPYQLWLRKTGQIPPTEENAAMKRGHWLEDGVAQYYSEATGLKIIKRSAGDWIMRDKERPWMQVSPDRTFWLPGLPKNDRNKGIVEIKTTLKSVDPENVPLNWIAQWTYQTGVAGYQRGSIAWLDGHMDFGHCDLEFDPMFYALIVEEVEKFWKDSVLGGKAPEPMTAEDVLMKSPMQTDGKTLTADEETVQAIHTLKAMKADEAEIKKNIEKLTDSLKVTMDDCESILDPETGKPLLTWKSSGKMTSKFDESAFKAAHPDLYAEFVKETPAGRRFLVK